MSVLSNMYRPRGSLKEIQSHIQTFMELIKLGREKFGKETEAGDIFRHMKGGEFLFNQAVGGTMYEYEKKLDYAVWDAAMHAYGEDMERLRAVLLRIVEANDFRDTEGKKEIALEMKAEIKKENLSEKVPTDWREELKREIAETDEARKKKREAEEYQETLLTVKEQEARELWRIVKEMETEFGEITRLGAAWFAAHGKREGCLRFASIAVFFPAGAFIGAVTWLI